jgi:hypothetical protein
MKKSLVLCSLLLSVIAYAAPAENGLSYYYPLILGDHWRINTFVEGSQLSFYSDFEVEKISNGQAMIKSTTTFIDAPGITGTASYQIMFNDDIITQVDKRGDATVLLKSPVKVGTQWVSGKSIWGKPITTVIIDTTATITIQDHEYRDVVVTQGMSWEDNIIYAGKKLPPHFEVLYHFYAKNTGYIGTKTTSAASKKAIAGHAKIPWLMSRE